MDKQEECAVLYVHVRLKRAKVNKQVGIQILTCKETNMNNIFRNLDELSKQIQGPSRCESVKVQIPNLLFAHLVFQGCTNCATFHASFHKNVYLILPAQTYFFLFFDIINILSGQLINTLHCILLYLGYPNSLLAYKEAQARKCTKSETSSIWARNLRVY